MNGKWVRRVALLGGLGALALGGAGCATVGGTAYAAEGGGGGAGVSVGLFYDTLAPYGSWEWVEGYGRVWRPDPYVVGADFQPYSTGGRWVYTDYGWSWESDWDWGWAPFHYGRWSVDPVLGWVWIPDTVWGPAWVDWRFGGGYVGWCPLGPGGFGISVGYRPYWSFVETRYFVEPNPYHYAVPVSRIHYAYQATQPIHQTVNYDRVHWNAGPPPGQISHAAGVQIRPLPIRPPPPGQVAAVRPIGVPPRPSPGVSGGFHAPPGSNAFQGGVHAVPPGRTFGNATPPAGGFGTPSRGVGTPSPGVPPRGFGSTPGHTGFGGVVSPAPGGGFGTPMPPPVHVGGNPGTRPPSGFDTGGGMPPRYGQVPGGFRAPSPSEPGYRAPVAPPPSRYGGTSVGGFHPPPARSEPSGGSYQPPPARSEPSGGSYQPPPVRSGPSGGGYQPPPVRSAPSGGGYQPPPVRSAPPGGGYHPPSGGGGGYQPPSGGGSMHAPSGGGGHPPPGRSHNR